jgi:hypothetical protein
VKGYIVQCNTDLISLLIDGIQRVNFEDEDDDSDEWGVASSSGCCLGYVSQVIGNPVMQPIINFVSPNITS